MPDPHKIETDKHEEKKNDSESPRDPFEKVFTGDRAQQAADNASLIKSGDNRKGAKLPDTQIVTDKTSAAADTATSKSWSNQSLPDALRHLDRIKPSAEAILNTVTSAGDRAQLNTYQLLKNVILPKLKEDGLLGKEWDIFPSVKNSPADKIGADFLLVNRKTGAFQFLDPTLNEDKKNIFELRRDGVILVESNLFETPGGALRVDEEGSIGERATKFQTNLESQIVVLASKPAAFKIGANGIPMPDLEPTENAKEQIDNTINWARKRAAETSGNEARDFREMADVIGNAKTHTAIAAVEKFSPKFDESARKATEAEVAKFAFAKYKRQEYKEAQENSNGNNVKVIKGDLKLNTKDGDFLTGGSIQTHLQESWGKLLNTKTFLSTLSNKDLKSMGAETTTFESLTGDARANAIEKAYKSQPKFRAEADKLRDTLHALRATIVEGGGAVAEGTRVIENNVVSRLKNRPEELLTGKPAATDKAGEQKAAATAQAEKAETIDKTAPKAFAELESYHKGEKFVDGKASASLSETMQLLVLDQESSHTWPPAELEAFKKVSDAYKDSSNPNHDTAVKQVNDWFNQRAEKPATAETPQAKTINIEAELKGNANFEHLTDAARQKAALTQLSERSVQHLADKKNNTERGEYLTQQLKAALRKQLGVSTDAQLPESLRKMQVKVVDGDGTASKVVQHDTTHDNNIEIPAKLLQENPKAAIAEAYTHAAGLTLIDALKAKGNEGVTFTSIKPMLDKIASQAESIVKTQVASIASREQAAMPAETTSSDRKIVLDPQKPLITTFDGENLVFAGEKFNVKTEIATLEKERSERVKDLESMAKRAKEIADSSKTADDVAKLKLIEGQLASAKQSLQVVGELKLAMNGERGASAQSHALKLVKTAADRAIAERMGPKANGGGVPLSRGAAMAMVITTLAFMYVGNNSPAHADSYETSFH